MVNQTIDEQLADILSGMRSMAKTEELTMELDRDELREYAAKCEYADGIYVPFLVKGLEGKAISVRLTDTLNYPLRYQILVEFYAESPIENSIPETIFAVNEKGESRSMDEPVKDKDWKSAFHYFLEKAN